jgi:hypothetical protein
MSEGDASPPLRIGNTERTAAMKALDEHLDEGRLGVEEYADRSAVAANATTADELRKLFIDLPPPYPTLPGAAGPSLEKAGASTPAVPAAGGGRRGGGRARTGCRARARRRRTPRRPGSAGRTTTAG